MITLRACETAAHIKMGTWEIGSNLVKNRATSIIDLHLPELVNKKVVFIAGGAGRVANYAAHKGIDSYNLDISEIYKTICANNYPKVNYIKANMCFPLEGFDYAFFEDCFTNRGYTPQFYETINNWQKVTKILPLSHSLYVYRFNSKTIDEYLTADESEGRSYIRKCLVDGKIHIFCSTTDVFDLDIEEIKFDFNNSMAGIFIEPYQDKKYTVLGMPHFQKNTIKGTIYIKGVNDVFLKNSVTPYRANNPDKYLVR